MIGLGYKQLKGDTSMIRDGVGYVDTNNILRTLGNSLPLTDKFPESRWVNRRNCFINISNHLFVAYVYMWDWRKE